MQYHVATGHTYEVSAPANRASVLLPGPTDVTIGPAPAVEERREEKKSLSEQEARAEQLRKWRRRHTRLTSLPLNVVQEGLADPTASERADLFLRHLAINSAYQTLKENLHQLKTNVEAALLQVMEVTGRYGSDFEDWMDPYTREPFGSSEDTGKTRI